MTVLASGSKGNSAVIAAGNTRILVDAGMSCRELLRRMAQTGEEPEKLDAILITHEHLDHVAGLAVLARKLRVPVFFTESTHRAWVRMVRPRRTMTYAQWLAHLQTEKEQRAAAAVAAGGHLPAHLHAGGTRGRVQPESQGSEAAMLSELTAPAEDPMGADAAPDGTLLRDEQGVHAGALAATAEPEQPCESDLDADTRAKAKADPAFLPDVEYFPGGAAVFHRRDRHPSVHDPA